MKQTKVKFITLLLYLFGFLLLLEWMRPVEELTDTGNIWTFVLFLILSLSFSYLNIRFLYSFFIKTVYILFVMQLLYYEGSFLQFEWLLLFFSDIVENVENLIFLQWEQLSDLFRSVLFFILLWLMTYLMKYWLVIQRQILIFLIMTFIYITVLDTFTPYDASGAIIRMVIIGFLLLGMLTYLRIIDKESVSRQSAHFKGWILPLLLVITSSTFFAYMMPKSEPNWPDPVPFLQSFVPGNEDSGTGTGGTGYGMDDSRLGGPFHGDDEVIYTTKTNMKHYWKVETKDVYTGKGWTSSQEGLMIPFEQGSDVPFSSYAPEFSSKENYNAQVESKVDYTHLIYPSGVKNISALGRYSAMNKYSFKADSFLEKIYAFDEEEQTDLGKYEVFYDAPIYKVEQLKNAELLKVSGRFLELYTQLPDVLPQRVKDLAQEITVGKNTMYDKTKAIERFFKHNGFIYDQKNVVVPGKNDDYVDQFLFETKKGYCDNYSTSMIVLLRSVGIPSRWVKGYTEGEYRGITQSGQQEYQITNNNAHSWVEVYFPEIGWVPFEPTIGFTGNAELDSKEHPENEEEPEERIEDEESENEKESEERLEDEESENEEPEEGVEDEEPENGEPETEEKEPEEESESSVEESSSVVENQGNLFTFLKKSWPILIYTFIFLVLVVVLILYLTRRKWLPHYYISRFKKRNENEDFLVAYRLLLKQLDRCGIKRRQDQTLREYAQIVDNEFSSFGMTMLTEFYEHYLYKGVLEVNIWPRTREIWEKIMKTIA